MANQPKMESFYRDVSPETIAMIRDEADRARLDRLRIENPQAAQGLYVVSGRTTRKTRGGHRDT